MTRESSRTIANLAHIESSNKQEALAILAEAIGVVSAIDSPPTPLPTTEFVPVSTQPPPPTVQATVILAQEGTLCNCSQCEKDVYKVTTSISNGMKAEEFARCLTPIDHTTAFPTPFDIQMLDKSALTNCPVCQGNMTLLLWGPRPKGEIIPGAEGGVSSIGGEGVEGGE